METVVILLAEEYEYVYTSNTLTLDDKKFDISYTCIVIYSFALHICTICMHVCKCVCDTSLRAETWEF
jgi:hypothetical protein